jgi:hypothetical protein
MLLPDRFRFVSEKMADSGRTRFAASVLAVEAAFLFALIIVLGVEWSLALWYLAVAFVAICALLVSDYVLERQLRLQDVDGDEIAQKTADSHARFFNVAAGAILTAAIGTFALSYSNRPKSFDYAPLDIMSVESWLPDFDNRMADLRNQYSIFSKNPLKDVFPLFFPSTLRDGSQDLGQLARLRAMDKDSRATNVAVDYQEFLNVADLYVRKARELADVSDRTQQTYSEPRQKVLIVELRNIQNDVRAAFFKFQGSFCRYVRSDEFSKVVGTIRSSRGYDFVLRSNFCAH